MRPSRRLFVSTREVSTYWNDGVIRTGLTGMLSHPYPRPHLLFVYNETLDKLATLPETSVYRQSAEALTKHRKNIVEATRPPGYDEWKIRATKQVETHPQLLPHSGKQGDIAKQLEKGRRYKFSTTVDERVAEWDEAPIEPRIEGALPLRAKAKQAKEFGAGIKVADLLPESRPELEKEPQLTAEQIVDLENKIGAGLIEEVVKVAERECKLVDVMKKHEVWEELAEKPVEGQWSYFQRDTATGQTQTP